MARTVRTTGTGWRGAAAALGVCALLWAAGCGGGSASHGTIGSGGTTGGGSGSGGGGNPVVTTEPLPYWRIDQGSQSGIRTEQSHLFTDPRTFQGVWDQHVNFSRPAPRFDFHNYSIIALFRGNHRGMGLRTEVVRVWRDKLTGAVHVLVRDYEAGGWRRMAILDHQPFDLVSIPAQPAGTPVVLHVQRRLDFTVVAQGAHSKIGAGNPSYTGGLQVFRDFASFDAFWQQHSGNGAPPWIDFAGGEMAVAVLGRYVPTGGNHVITRRIVADPAAPEVRVDWELELYRGGAVPAQSETPFQILRVQGAPGTVRTEVRTPLAVTEIERGQQAAYGGTQPKTLVVRDAQEFDDTYRWEVGTGPSIPLDPARETAVFVFLGRKNTGGYEVRLGRADLLEDGELDLELHYRQPTGPAPSVITSPYQVATIPATWGPVSVRNVDMTPRP